jgi:hypothetical protein
VTDPFDPDLMTPEARACGQVDAARTVLRLLLEEPARQSALADDRSECSDANFAMIRNGNGRRAARVPTLHHHVAAALPHLDEAGAREDLADVAPGEDAEPTQRSPRTS